MLDRSGVGTATLDSVAPDFTVQLLDGGEFRLSDHMANDGRPVIVNLWASWCIPCRVETPELSAFAASNPDVLLIGVAVQDTEDQAQRFAAEFQPFHDLAFGDEEFEKTYPTLGLPATFFIDEERVLVDIIFGVVNTPTLEAAFSSG